jgi:hypothetical protein
LWVLIISGVLTAIVFLSILDNIGKLYESIKQSIEYRDIQQEHKSLSSTISEALSELSYIDFASTPKFSPALIIIMADIVAIVDTISPLQDDPEKATILFNQEQLRYMIAEPNERYRLQLEAANNPRFAALEADISN